MLSSRMPKSMAEKKDVAQLIEKNGGMPTCSHCLLQERAQLEDFRSSGALLVEAAHRYQGRASATQPPDWGGR
ncbi:hypothetical protein GN244_ATG14960 [Phytophthora infestans]|uniref:Uncharacterized protein n=1 Tax=Phytophthora infestans TaxID=4787 RepID=A0A833S524_PHYIN|nr:hypothetical protein GN244_ATG14960 [Phytophthora infestans]KAF4129947.1 hypothetical protein GN958_ATG20839 [Phytophthora infestans]